MSALGDRIRRAREQRGWTQAQLAAEVGVARETIGNWETGASSPRNAMGRLEAVLGTPLAGDPPASVRGAQDDVHAVLLDLPATALEGLSEVEREEVIARAKATALQAAREIKRSE